MTDIWDEKPKHDISSQVEYYCFIYYKDEMDAWLDRLRGKYLNLTDYERWWMELRELLREYLVDCNDADIIFSELKVWKEKAEKWDEIKTIIDKCDNDALMDFCADSMGDSEFKENNEE